MICGAVSELDDTHGLWRRVRDDPDDLTWHSEEQRWLPRPEQPSIQFNPDLSCYWREHLVEQHASGPRSAIGSASRYALVFELAAGQARNLRCLVEHSPQGPTVPDCAHSSVRREAGLTRAERAALRNDLAYAMRLVYGVPTQQPPPGA